ncbi:MAG: NAD(P)H-quinone oxidoreductase [Bacteroidota bacterium]
MKALIVDHSGDRPVMMPGEYPDPVPGERELLVGVKATAINRADLGQKAGKYPPPKGASNLLGLEMAGVVEQVGSKVTQYRPGDRVFGLLPGGGYAQRCVIHEEMAMPVPDAFSFEQAAAVPEAFLTAWQALSWLGGIGEGERVLIHAGASGVGTAAIQLGKVHFGTKVAVTVGSREKEEFCSKLGADMAVNYNQEDFVKMIAGSWGEKKTDLIIDVVGAPYWKRNIDLLGMDGRLVLLAFMGGSRIEHVALRDILRMRLTVRGSTLRSRSTDYKIALTRDFYEQTNDLFLKERLKPVIDSVFDWTEAEKAHKRMEQNLNTGKLVLAGFE